jgi:hypothetical protein
MRDMSGIDDDLQLRHGYVMIEEERGEKRGEINKEKKGQRNGSVISACDLLLVTNDNCLTGQIKGRRLVATLFRLSSFSHSLTNERRWQSFLKSLVFLFFFPFPPQHPRNRHLILEYPATFLIFL